MVVMVGGWCISFRVGCDKGERVVGFITPHEKCDPEWEAESHTCPSGWARGHERGRSDRIYAQDQGLSNVESLDPIYILYGNKNRENRRGGRENKALASNARLAYPRARTTFVI